MRDRDVGRASGWMGVWADGPRVAKRARMRKSRVNILFLLATRNRKRVLALSISARLARTQRVRSSAHILKKIVLQS